MKVQEKCVRDFINNAKQYTEIRKLTPEILKTFISRIEVYEKAVKHSRTCGNHIVICFTFWISVEEDPFEKGSPLTASGPLCRYATSPRTAGSHLKLLP